jgi:hypothetical protein
MLGSGVTFFLVSDGTPEELREFIAEFQPLTTFQQDHRDVSDLLNMANADGIVCSISSYSQWAAFLSNAPYFWYRPQLQPTDGHLTIWGTLGEPSAEEVALNSEVYPRGIPVDEDGALPSWLGEFFRMRRGMNHQAHDLVRQGGVPAMPRAQASGIPSTLERL